MDVGGHRARPRLRRAVALVGGVAGLVTAGLSSSPAVAAAQPGPGGGGTVLTAHPWPGGGQRHGAQPAVIPSSGLEVVAAGLNQPHHLTFGPDGNLYVAEAGDGQAPPTCTDGNEPSCADTSGSVDRVTLQGQVTPVVTGLSSVGGGAPVASAGPAGVAFGPGGSIATVVQDQNINPTTGAESYGPAGSTLGDLVVAPPGGGPAVKLADLAAYEAAHNPDNGEGANPQQGEAPIDSDPYNVVAYNGGYAVADAAGDDVLFVSAAGAISVLAVLPLVPESFMGQTVMAQPVPTSLAVGPDGALYVGELGGGPNDVGAANIYRIGNGGTLTTVASGLTMVGSIAFDQQHRLLALEIDTAGLGDPNPVPNPGALIRINGDGSQTVLANDGLEYPLGLAVGSDGSIYTTNYGVIPGQGGVIPGASGEIVRIGGYRLAAADGGVFDFGSYGFYGSEGGQHLNAPVVGVASDPSGPGYWLAAADGGVFAFGHARFQGSEGSARLAKPIVGMAATPDGGGYWLVAADGGVFNFGDAAFEGSVANARLSAPIVGMAATPDGGGYYLFGADGGVFALGDATFAGSLGNVHLNKTIVGGASPPVGGGYYMVGADGGVFSFGGAGFFGSAASQPLAAPMVGMQTSGTGGYDLVAADGGVFNYGSAPFAGSLAGKPLQQPIVGIG